MTNTARHETACASQPPSSGPIAAVIAAAPDHVPIARPRAAPAKLAEIKARLPGVASAPPTPWIARATSRKRRLGASAHAADAAAKSAMPTTKIRRRPYTSPSEPPTRMSAARKSA